MKKLLLFLITINSSSFAQGVHLGTSAEFGDLARSLPLEETVTSSINDEGSHTITVSSEGNIVYDSVGMEGKREEILHDCSRRPLSVHRAVIAAMSNWVAIVAIEKDRDCFVVWYRNGQEKNWKVTEGLVDRRIKNTDALSAMAVEVMNMKGVVFKWRSNGREYANIFYITTNLFIGPPVDVTPSYSLSKKDNVPSIQSEPGFSYIHPSDVPDNVYYFEITPSQIDPTHFRASFRYWTSVPVFSPNPNFVGLSDFNKNGLTEVQGEGQDSHGDPEAWEVSPDGTSKKIFRDSFYNNIGSWFGDAHLYGDNTWQRLNLGYDSVNVYTQRMPTSFTDSIFTSFFTGRVNQVPIIAKIDGNDDYDVTVIAPYRRPVTGIMEFNKSQHRFNLVWEDTIITPYYPALADFNKDGKNEIVQGNLDWTDSSHTHYCTALFFLENTGIHQYKHFQEVLFQNFRNDMQSTAGDIDGDGYPEAIAAVTGGDNHDKKRFWVFERKPNAASGADSFELVQAFQINESEGFGGPEYTVVDITGDGVPELCISISRYSWVFTKKADNQYKLLYILPRWGCAGSLWDFNHDGHLDYINSGRDSAGYYSDIYLYDSTLLDVAQTSQESQSNLRSAVFPQPMGENGIIAVELPNDDVLSIEIYDVMGRCVSTPAYRQKFSQGLNKLPLSLPTNGTYFYHIQSLKNGGASGKVLRMKF